MLVGERRLIFLFAPLALLFDVVALYRAVPYAPSMLGRSADFGL
jgi:hypothetical protein